MGAEGRWGPKARPVASAGPRVQELPLNARCVGNRLARLPPELHALVAMVAPRGLFIMTILTLSIWGPSLRMAALGGAEVCKASGASETITIDGDAVPRVFAMLASHALTLSRSHALTLSRSHALTLSRSHALTLSRSHALTLSRSRALARRSELRSLVVWKRVRKM
jgi:hypothetical protein